jgi:hypothetical protein
MDDRIDHRKGTHAEDFPAKNFALALSVNFASA